MFQIKTIITIAGLCVIAQTVAAGGISSCPAAGVLDSYSASSPCTAYDQCLTDYCACQGATGADTNNGICIWSASMPSCGVAQNCLANLMPCFNTAASGSSCQDASGLSSLRTQLMNLAAGSVYFGSRTYQACELHTCMLLNQSVASAGLCPLSEAIAAACVPPYTYTGQLTLSGSWNNVLASDRTGVINAVQADLTQELGMQVTVTSVRAGSLIVVFTVPVSDNNSTLQERIADAQANSSWLNNTATTYKNNGGQGSITVSSIVTVTSAPANLTPPPSAPTKSNAGMIAGIVIGVLAAVCAIGALSYFLLRPKRKSLEEYTVLDVQLVSTEGKVPEQV